MESTILEFFQGKVYYNVNTYVYFILAGEI